MSSPNPKDFLSAFYDREATSDEEAAAKALVERSPEASREVQDYRRLSRLLQDVPRIAAPPEFAAAVMQRAERESLIPLDAVAPAVAAQPRRRRWVLAVSASVAAAVLIAVGILNWPARRPAAQQFAVREPAASSAESAIRKVSIGARGELDAERKDGLAHANIVAKRSVALGASVAKSIDGRLPVASKAKGFVSRDLPPARPGQTAAMSAPTLGKDAVQETERLALILPANLKTAKVGDVVEALQQDGEQVAVVRLTVVNQVEGLDGVQSVLMHNTSRTLQNADEIKRMRQKFVADNAAEVSKSELPSAPGDMICVYAEGSRDEMLRVLQDLQNESHIQKAELTNTIAFTMLEKYASHAVPANKQGKEQTAAKSQVVNGPVAQSSQGAGSQLAVSLPAATVDKIFSARRAAASPGRQTQSAAPGLVARQTQVEPDASSFKRGSVGQSGKKWADSNDQGAANKAAQRGAPNRAAAPQVAKQDDRSRLRDSKQVVATPKSFQIFFVITDQPVVPTPQSASGAAKAAAASRDRPAAGQATPAPAKAAPANPAP